MKKILALVMVAFVVCLMPANNAYAYLDPGTGSYIFQLLIAFLCGAAFTIKIYWGKIKLMFKRKKDSNDKS